MVVRRKAAATVTASLPTVKKTKSSGGGAKKKLSAYNKFMRTEMARLKDSDPDISHKERFGKATSNWKTAKENPKAA